MMQAAIKRDGQGTAAEAGVRPRVGDLAKVLAELLVELLLLAPDRLGGRDRIAKPRVVRDDSGRLCNSSRARRHGPHCRSRRPIPRAARRSEP